MDGLILLVMTTTVFAGAVLDEIPKLFVDAKIVEMHKVARRIRGEHGLADQRLDEECCRTAQNWANYMAKTNRFHHGGEEQIIARGYETADGVFRGWMNSKGHRHWVLSDTELCGWGRQRSKDGTWYWVGVFRNTGEKP